MTESLKSGQEIVDNFFVQLSGAHELDQGVVDILKALYAEGKLTPTNIANALDATRNEALNDVNK